MTSIAPAHGLRRHAGHGVALTATVVAAAGVTYTLLARDHGERWNATDAEVAAVLPGDALIPEPLKPMTRAVTIDAAPAQVWPWIVQFGQGRGGLYSYDWLENLVGCDIHSLDHIDPALQDLAVGDRVQVTPEGYPADLGMVVDEVIPERALVLRLSTPKQPFTREQAPWTWAFVLDPLPDGRTRLVVRERYRSNGAVADAISRQLVGPLDLVMSRRMLTGIAERAERTAGTGPGPSSAETMWFAGLLVAGAGLGATLASRLPLRARVPVAAAGSSALTLLVFRFWTPWAAWSVAAASVAVAVGSWRAPTASAGREPAVVAPASAPSDPRPVTP